MIRATIAQANCQVLQLSEQLPQLLERLLSRLQVHEDAIPALTPAHRTHASGRRHAGTNVLLLIHDLHIRVVTTDGRLLRELQLDPTKDYQPQTKP